VCGVGEETSCVGFGSPRGFGSVVGVAGGLLSAVFGGFQRVEHAIERGRGPAQFGVGAIGGHCQVGAEDDQDRPFDHKS
jgi:hypothetical protein